LSGTQRLDAFDKDVRGFYEPKGESCWFNQLHTTVCLGKLVAGNPYGQYTGELASAMPKHSHVGHVPRPRSHILARKMTVAFCELPLATDVHALD
jgi:hypothetical protein